MINARTTFIEFSQPPDFGSLFMREGKSANMVNGRANARPNPNIPTVGLRTDPDAASTSKAPTRGPVHENETSTVVRPRKKAAITPPLSTFASVEFTHLLGKTISKAPKNEEAKTMKR